jgi:hypothetical protein
VQCRFEKEGSNIRFNAKPFLRNDVKPSAGLMGEIKQALKDSVEIAAEMEKIV